MSEDVIDLSSAKLFAKGGTRYCFFHPDDQSICIKVDQETSPEAATLREATYVARMKRIRRRDHFSSINKHYGVVNTNLGIALVCEIVRNKTDGNISNHLRHLMLSERWPAYRDKVRAALDDFQRRILSDAIMLTNLNADNICVQHLNDTDIRLVSIDGVGHKNTFFKELRLDYSPFLTRRKMKKVMKKNYFDDIDTIIANFGDDRDGRGLVVN